MTLGLDTYQKLAYRTAPKGRLVDDCLVNFGVGLVTESCEYLDYVKKGVWHGDWADGREIGLELGDALWYLSCSAKMHGWLLSEIASWNVAKLRERYPNGFEIGGGERE